MDFISKTVSDMARKKKMESTSESEDDEEMHPLLLKVFHFLLNVHSAEAKAIRFRVCQLLSKLLHDLGEGAQIDDELYDRIYKCMGERLRDKSSQVRVHAVLALTRLQDPTDESCAIIKAFILLLARDPSDDVRRAILSCIVPCKATLPSVLTRTRDVKDKVRRTAFVVIADKFPLKAMSIDQRIKLLNDGLNDRSDLVKVACSNKLLQSWLIDCEGNVLDLLARLDVQSSVKTCETALNILFKKSEIGELVQRFDIINDKAMIDEDKLTCENSFYWRNLMQFIYTAGHEYDEQLDKVRPNCVEFCSYVKSYAALLSECKDVDKILDMEFIIQQLLQIIFYMDLSDQVSRKQTEKLVHGLLVSDNVGPALVTPVLKCMQNMYTDIEFINYIAETISEIREPITTIETQINVEAQRNIDKKIAGIRVKLHELRDELSICIERQEFERAAQLKSDISNLDSERSSLLEEAEPKLQEVRTQRNDPVILLKCLTIINEVLSTLTIKRMTPALQGLMESQQILPGMANEDADIRNNAVRAIGLYCLISKDLVMQNLPILLQASQMDTHLVRSTAFKSIFDLVQFYGLEAFSDCSKDANLHINTPNDKSCEERTELQNGVEREGSTVWSESAGKVITILSSTLDNENSELRNIAAEGLAKLLLSGRVVSSKLLSHLLLLWYNPLVEDDEVLIRTLGDFFPLFAFANSANQEVVEEAFVPTLRTVLHAPLTSPLAEIDEMNLANFLIELMDAQNLSDNQLENSLVKENPCHDNIAVKLCNEILSHPDSSDTKLWLKVLNQLSINPENTSLQKNLLALCEHMATEITDKQCCNLLKKFRSTLSVMIDAMKEQMSNSKRTATNRNKEDQVLVGDGGDNNVQDDHQKQPSTEDLAMELADSVGNLSLASLHPSTVKKTKNNLSQAVTKSAHAKRAKSLLKSTSKPTATSDLDDNVFATPVLKGSRLASDKDEVRVQLENLFLDGPKTPLARGKTPKTPKRPLHSIQNPKFTE
ncbi:unnamed protein product [Lymnaea stagnalis]|uniref:Nuclear condensin complex subunit 3 C-terminal domain-containing protein n=1 Tax=Lymnaea stagnalis TaxID=6523 RepID=A0AAV2H5N2_LYMST